MTLTFSMVKSLLDEIELLRLPSCHSGAEDHNARIDRIGLTIGALLAAPSTGPGSVDDERKALLQLTDAMPTLAPHATGLSHGMRLILRAAQCAPEWVRSLCPECLHFPGLHTHDGCCVQGTFDGVQRIPCNCTRKPESFK